MDCRKEDKPTTSFKQQKSQDWTPEERDNAEKSKRLQKHHSAPIRITDPLQKKKVVYTDDDASSISPLSPASPMMEPSTETPNDPLTSSSYPSPSHDFQDLLTDVQLEDQAALTVPLEGIANPGFWTSQHDEILWMEFENKADESSEIIDIDAWCQEFAKQEKLDQETVKEHFERNLDEFMNTFSEDTETKIKYAFLTKYKVDLSLMFQFSEYGTVELKDECICRFIPDGADKPLYEIKESSMVVNLENSENLETDEATKPLTPNPEKNTIQDTVIADSKVSQDLSRLPEAIKLKYPVYKMRKRERRFKAKKTVNIRIGKKIKRISIAKIVAIQSVPKKSKQAINEPEVIVTTPELMCKSGEAEAHTPKDDHTNDEDIVAKNPKPLIVDPVEDVNAPETRKLSQSFDEIDPIQEPSRKKDPRPGVHNLKETNDAEPILLPQTDNVAKEPTDTIHRKREKRNKRRTHNEIAPILEPNESPNSGDRDFEDKSEKKDASEDATELIQAPIQRKKRRRRTVNELMELESSKTFSTEKTLSPPGSCSKAQEPTVVEKTTRYSLRRSTRFNYDENADSTPESSAQIEQAAPEPEEETPLEVTLEEPEPVKIVKRRGRKPKVKILSEIVESPVSPKLPEAPVDPKVLKKPRGRSRKNKEVSQTEEVTEEPEPSPCIPIQDEPVKSPIQKQCLESLGTSKQLESPLSQEILVTPRKKSKRSRKRLIDNEEEPEKSPSVSSNPIQEIASPIKNTRVETQNLEAAKEGRESRSTRKSKRNRKSSQTEEPSSMGSTRIQNERLSSSSPYNKLGSSKSPTPIKRSKRSREEEEEPEKSPRQLLEPEPPSPREPSEVPSTSNYSESPIKRTTPVSPTNFEHTLVDHFEEIQSSEIEVPEATYQPMWSPHHSKQLWSEFEIATKGVKKPIKMRHWYRYMEEKIGFDDDTIRKQFRKLMDEFMKNPFEGVDKKIHYAIVTKYKVSSFLLAQFKDNGRLEESRGRILCFTPKGAAQPLYQSHNSRYEEEVQRILPEHTVGVEDYHKKLHVINEVPRPSIRIKQEIEDEGGYEGASKKNKQSSLPEPKTSVYTFLYLFRSSLNEFKGPKIREYMEKIARLMERNMAELHAKTIDNKMIFNQLRLVFHIACNQSAIPDPDIQIIDETINLSTFLKKLNGVSGQLKMFCQKLGELENEIADKTRTLSGNEVFPADQVPILFGFVFGSHIKFN